MDSNWWRRFPDSPTGGPTLSRQLNLASVLLAALRHNQLTKDTHLPTKVTTLATTDPALSIVPTSWLCYIMEEHLKSEFTLSSDSRDVFPKDTAITRADLRETSLPPLRWKRAQADPATPPPIKRRVFLHRKFLLRPRSYEDDEDDTAPYHK